MTDLSPTGEPFAISDRASASARLERGYRRLVKLYPRSYRRESTEEIIAVLLATAREDQRYPSVLETADLLRGALRMWLGMSKCPRTVLYAVRLMYLGALAQAAVLVTALVTAGSIRAAAVAAAVRALGPHPEHAVVQQTTVLTAGLVGYHLSADVLVTLLAISGWLVLAGASGKGASSARPWAIILCAFDISAVALKFAQGDLSLAPAATIAAAVTVAIAIASVIFLLARPSWRYYKVRDASRAVAR